MNIPMSYQVLARKWRPKQFQDLIGQESIVRMLSNAITQQRLHHAYLFTGTRGVGKTTIARILAKCLNCEMGITATPCGQCKICQSIDAGQFLDLYEVDAASRTKVEDTRELLENVMYAPNQGRYKIYLIDEVHMLSNHSFNALLKTLEEPPAHVKFLLATTDPKRLPITVLSRCLQFHLKRIPESLISKHLQHICDHEKLTYDTDALTKLAHAADGSMRDALSLLDQAIAYGQGAVKKEEVNAMLGCVAQDDVIPLLDALAKKDGSALFQRIHALSEGAPDFAQLFDELSRSFHQLALKQIVPNALNLVENLQPFVTQFSPEDIQLYYQMTLLGRRDLAFTPSPQQAFEMTLLRMLAFTQDEHQPATKTTSQKPQPQPAPKTPSPEKIAAPAAVSASLPDWRELLANLKLSGMAQALASNCHLQSLDGTKAVLVIAANHAAMLNPNLKERINTALNSYLQKTIQLEIQTTTENISTPSKLAHEEHVTKLAQAKETILKDPKVKQLIEMYDATVDVSMVS